VTQSIGGLVVPMNDVPSTERSADGACQKRSRSVSPDPPTLRRKYNPRWVSWSSDLDVYVSDLPQAIDL
jgi:hypothetical protein